VEYLFPAGSFVEPSGPSYSVEAGGGLLTMVPVRIRASGKALTVEELRAQKRDAHVAAFRRLLAETERDLARIAGDGGALDARLARDPSREWDLADWLDGGRAEWLLPGMAGGGRVAFSAAGLLARIGRQCEAVAERHAAVPPERYADDEAFRGVVTEMLETRAAAVATLRLYLEDAGAKIENVMRNPITAWHRVYLSFLERTLPAGGEARAAAAARLCRAMGAMSGSVEEEDAEGLTPLMRAAAAGAGGRALRALVAARADVNRRDAAGGRTALWLAAEGGHEVAVAELARLGGDPDATAEPGVFDNTPVWIAAQEGHAAVIAELGRLGADVNRAVLDGRTPVYMAAARGHAAAIEELGRLGADVNRASGAGWTPLRIAVDGERSEAADALRRLGAAL
jgi:hypothetical protein